MTGWFVNKELEIIWKKAVVAYFEIPEGLRNTTKLLNIAGHRAKISTLDVPALATRPRRVVT
jgi:hypothetical protein